MGRWCRKWWAAATGRSTLDVPLHDALGFGACGPAGVWLAPK
jgi:hypothetical protein